MNSIRLAAGTFFFLFLSIFVSVPQVYSQSRSPQSIPAKKDSGELVLRIKNASVEELKKLTFLELNLLKNAVYAAKGYKFADDRPWLNAIFCEKRYKGVKRGGIAAGRAAMESWISKFRGVTPWDLEAYDFPPCKEGGDLDLDQMKALANIRVAMFKKIESYKEIRAVDLAMDEETNMLPKEGDFVWVLGKAVPLCAVSQCAQDSVRRELHGYNRLLQLIRNPERFDMMELLGLYTGDIIFVRNVIEAKQGKAFDGVLGWEISQLIGVTEKKAAYDPKKLPADVQTILQMLDEVVKNILSSDLNDVPSSLKGKSLEFLDPYNGGAC